MAKGAGVYTVRGPERHAGELRVKCAFVFPRQGRFCRIKVRIVRVERPGSRYGQTNLAAARGGDSLSEFDCFGVANGMARLHAQAPTRVVGKRSARAIAAGHEREVAVD